MIIPLVNEAEWLRSIDMLPAWDAPSGPVLVIAPHPDDETLGAGGFIASSRLRGTDVVVAAVTDGENAYPDVPDLAQSRRIEQETALRHLGVESEKIVRLQIPDSNVGSYEMELFERLMKLVTHETHIMAPWRGDFHPDHEACGRAAELVASRTGAKLTSYLFWTWHRGTPALLRDLEPRSFHLDRQLLLAKTEALLCHRSQLSRESNDPILPESLLAPARRSFETFLCR